MKTYNIWYRNKNQECSYIKGLSLKDCKEYIESNQIIENAIEMRIDQISNENEKINALRGELTQHEFLKTCMECLLDNYYSFGPLEDSDKADDVRLSLTNINNSINIIKKKIKEFSE
jgi:hypothetical protein